jgi:hypothetical protein
MTPDNKIELHIPSIMGFEKVAMECAATEAGQYGSVIRPDFSNQG